MAYDTILGIAETARKYGVFDRKLGKLLTVALYTDNAQLEHCAAVYMTGKILRRYGASAMSL
jgi:hypothetical protein